MGLIKTADQILGGRPRPVDVIGSGGKGRSRRGRPPLYVGCKVGNCPEDHHGNGYCRKHNRAFGKYGHPLATFRWAPSCTCASCPIHQPGSQPFQRPGKRKDAIEQILPPAGPKGYIVIPEGQG